MGCSESEVIGTLFPPVRFKDALTGSCKPALWTRPLRPHHVYMRVPVVMQWGLGPLGSGMSFVIFFSDQDKL